MTYTELLVAYPRLVVCGEPRAGKTTLCWQGYVDRPVLSTDAYGPGAAEALKLLDLEPRGLDWDSVQGAVMADCLSLGGRWVVEGCRAAWCLRDGLQADAAVWVRGHKVKPTEGQLHLGRSTRSVWEDWAATAKIPVLEI